MRDTKLLLMIETTDFKAVVDDYIATSNQLAQKYCQNHDINLSSATVQYNGRFEKGGYLTTLLRRTVPSDKGYRAYVDF